MQTMTVEEAQSRLTEILAQLTPGDEIVLTRDAKPVATVRSITPFFPQSPDAATGARGSLALPTMSVAEAQSQLPEVIENLAPAAEIVLTGNRKLIATIRPPLPAPREPRRLGTLKGTVLYMAPDFDDIPEGFEDYLPNEGT